MPQAELDIVYRALTRTSGRDVVRATPGMRDALAKGLVLQRDVDEWLARRRQSLEVVEHEIDRRAQDCVDGRSAAGGFSRAGNEVFSRAGSEILSQTGSMGSRMSYCSIRMEIPQSAMGHPMWYDRLPPGTFGLPEPDTMVEFMGDMIPGYSDAYSGFD